MAVSSLRSARKKEPALHASGRVKPGATRPRTERAAIVSFVRRRLAIDGLASEAVTGLSGGRTALDGGQREACQKKLQCNRIGGRDRDYPIEETTKRHALRIGRPITHAKRVPPETPI